MYLKGYEIKYDKDKTLTLPKWDFGGDKPWTNSVWNGLVSRLRSLSINSFPMSILDIDKEDSKVVTIKNQKEFEDWLKNGFDKKEF